MHLTAAQWALGGAAALLIGFSKTGMPGVGILVVPLLAAAFEGRPSVGIMLPMLIVGDCFAVYWYKRHARWDKLWQLVPWVLVGMAVGGIALKVLGEQKSHKDVMNVLIGVLVIAMLVIHLLRKRMGDRLTPHSRAGVVSTGASAGFATTVSNAAGPIMSIYLTSLGLPKDQFMGTTAWYYFIFNLVKLPIYAALKISNPHDPIMTASSLLFDLAVVPMILVGVFSGKWILPRMNEKVFEGLILALAAVAAVKLVIG